MRIRKITSNLFAWLVLLISLYSFLLENGVFDGDFDNDPIAWLMLAGGIFASVSLTLLASLVDSVLHLAQRP